MVGGLALHADGGFVMSGPTSPTGATARCGCCWTSTASTRSTTSSPTPTAGCMPARSAPTSPTCGAEKVPASATASVRAARSRSSTAASRCPTASACLPTVRTLYHVDSTTKGIWAHDLAADGTVSNRRHIGRAAFERGIPDGMCVDVDGNLWVAHVGGRRVVKLSPSGDELDEIPVPAKAVTSVAFGGPDAADMYIVTADHLEEPDRRGPRVPLPARCDRPRDATGDGLIRCGQTSGASALSHRGIDASARA